MSEHSPLSPINSLSYSLRRYYVDSFFAHHIPSVASNARVLDIGGHKTAKRGHFDIHQYHLQVVYANLTVEKSPDVQADGSDLPFNDNTFDVIICAELLEHVPYPPAILREGYRVLKSDGVILLSVPFLYHIHADPYDYGRYTDFYWQENLSAIGFKNIQIEKQGLFWTVMANNFNLWVYELSKENRPKWLLSRRLLRRIARWTKQRSIQLDLQESYRQNSFYSRFTTGFGIRCVKP